MKEQQQKARFGTLIQIMYRAIIVPIPDDPKLALLRTKYDPFVGLVGPHVTLVFPFPDRVTDDELHQHITTVLKNAVAFDARLHGLSKTWDHVLTLDVASGQELLAALHDALYTGPLEQFLRSDIPYQPHVALGLFVDASKYDILAPSVLPLDETKYADAHSEAEALELDYAFKVDSVDLVTLDDALTNVVFESRFSFG